MNYNGKPNNKAFKPVQVNKDQYYYISAQINLAGLESNDVYYFNKENNLTYMDSMKVPYPDEYGKYYTIDEHSVIGEVVVYSNPDIVYSGDLSNIFLAVGGVYKPSVTLNTDNSMDIWGGPTGNIPGSITIDDIKLAQICYNGSVPLQPMHMDYGSRKYLALKILDSQSTAVFSKGIIGVVVKVYPKFQH